MDDPFRPNAPLTTLGSGAPATTGIPTFTQPLPTAKDPEAVYEQTGHNWVWDKLGRFVFGSNEPGADGKSGGVLGDIPVLGPGLRGVGQVVTGAALDPAGFGIGKIVGAVATGLGTLPDPKSSGLGSDLNSGVRFVDPKYDPNTKGPGAAKALFDDLLAENGNGNLARQFLVVGQWMKQYDPEAFAEWQKALADAQSQAGFGTQGAETVSNFLSQWGQAYADLTPEGIKGYLETAPEIMYGGSGSLGQGLVRDMAFIFNVQRHAEIGAAIKTGSQTGLLGDSISTHLVYEGQPDFGSRMNELLFLSDTDPGKLNPIEKSAVTGMKDLGWDAKHAYNFLVSHGQGYSSDALSQLTMSFALDPIGVASMGAAEAATVGGKAALYANTVQSSTRLGRMAQAGAKAIGTTVAAVRADPVLGPASKVIRTFIDPLSSMPGPAGQATRDILGATALEGTRRGFGASAVTNASRLSQQLGISDLFTRTYALTATNFARKFVAKDYVGNILRFTETSTRRVLPEDIIEHAAKMQAKDVASRLADFVQEHRQFYLSSAGLDQLAERMAKMASRGVDEIKGLIKNMSPDDQSIWHALTYSHAWTQFKTTVNAIPRDAWGRLSKRIDDMVLLNPHDLDLVSAKELRDSLKAIKGRGAVAKKIDAWNAAADKYTAINEIGRVSSGGVTALNKVIDRLERVIEQGGLHHAVTPDEMTHLPQKFVDDFLSAWVGSDGVPIWRLGFRPSAEQATGLIRNAAGDLVQAFAPNIENVVDAAPMLTRRAQPLTDMLGRTIAASPVAGPLLAGKDALEVAINTARDNITGQRIITNMEQRFVRSVMKDPVLGKALTEKKASTIFRLARNAAQEDGFTIAGLGPEQFFKATEQELAAILEAKVVKRELFGHLAVAAGGDLRVLGLTSGMTQRIRGGLIARGVDPNAYLGAVTVRLYNLLRYTLNPTFFLQAEFDAPWFNMYRGVMPLGGGGPKPGSAIWEMDRISGAIGHTMMVRDLMMDFTERITNIGWQQDVVNRLGKMPGVKEGIGSRMRNWSGRMILNNEMAFINSRLGETVFDALDEVRRVIDDKIANAATDGERQAWIAARQDQVPMLDYLSKEFTDAYGRVPTREELGRHYLMSMIDDSRLEVRTAEGLLDYQKVAQRGAYHVPTTVGELKALHLDYGAESLSLPNIHSAADLRKALKDGTVAAGDIKDIMRKQGFHPDHIRRFTTAIQFNWRHYFDDLAKQLHMTTYEMQGIEDMIARSAKNANMRPTEYITQVLPMTAADGLDAHMKFVLDTMRLAKKGEAGIDDMAKLVTSHIQPSMKIRLLEHFMRGLTGKDGRIQKLMDAGLTAEAQELQQTLEALKGGWGPAANTAYRDLVVQYATPGANIAAMGLSAEVERGVRFFSKYLQDLGPERITGDIFNAIVDNIPTEGASAFDFTQGLLMNTLAENFRLAEKDAIRLAHMSTERTMFGRSLNHPFFGMYPSSYWWGKVIPETFRFMAVEPFGLKTTLGAEAYYKVQQNIAIQAQYDPRLEEAWGVVGKSAVMSLLAYLSPGMPWEDMAMNLPPWVRALAKGGGFTEMLTKEINTITPLRWVQKINEAGAEIGDAASGILSPTPEGRGQSSMPGSITVPQAQGLNNIGSQSAPLSPTDQVPTSSGPVKGTGLAPVLANEMADLEKVLSGR